MCKYLKLFLEVAAKDQLFAKTSTDGNANPERNFQSSLRQKSLDGSSMAGPEPSIPHPLDQCPEGPQAERHPTTHGHIFNACPSSTNQFADCCSGPAKAASPYPNEQPPLHYDERKVERDDLRVLLPHPGLRASAALEECPAYR